MNLLSLPRIPNFRLWLMCSLQALCKLPSVEEEEGKRKWKRGEKKVVLSLKIVSDDNTWRRAYEDLLRTHTCSKRLLLVRYSRL